MMRFIWTAFLLLLAVAALAVKPVNLSMTVDGVVRTAVVYPGVNATHAPTPLILAFHGYGGTSGWMARASRLHLRWPEATVVYPQGLPTTSLLLGVADKPGWQMSVDAHGGRDIRFVELLLEQLAATYRIDHRQIYATGMSNGAWFCYLLLTLRPEPFAAFAPVAGASMRVKTATVPRPVLIIQGAADTIVKPALAEATRDLVLKLNKCGNNITEWMPGYQCYGPCETGMPVIWRLHPGGHTWPADASAHIVRFFQEHRLADDSGTR